MMSYGFDPSLSVGAIKSPIFQTSTFVFENAEDGKAFFEVATGKRDQKEGEKLGLIYSRLNNPDLEILENRLTLWDEAEDAAVFESGMSAITTTLLKFLSPGDLLVYSNPLYGGTDHFIKHELDRFKVKTLGFNPGLSRGELEQLIEESGEKENLKMIYVETPANPTNDLVDLEMCRSIADKYAPENETLVVVDNTYMGPLWSHPLKLGADLVLYSATKYIGGHSDVIAGACLGSKELIGQIKGMRTYLGSMAGPWTGWLLLRSLETLKIRMEKQAENAKRIFEAVNNHPKIESIHYLGAIPENDPQYPIYKKQYSSAGAMISLEITGGEKEAFTFLNNLKIIQLAVSLGSTESLAQHPATMTHAGVDPEDKISYGIKDNLVRISVGVENPDDLIWDLEQALEKVKIREVAEID